MKTLFLSLCSLALVLIHCTKDNNPTNCTQVTITQIVGACELWAINTGTDTYPSDNIPDQFKQDGLAVCATFELFEDTRLCACCGGTWANIKSIRAINP